MSKFLKVPAEVNRVKKKNVKSTTFAQKKFTEYCAIDLHYNTKR